jgi:hypothetical protein
LIHLLHATLPSLISFLFSPPTTWNCSSLASWPTLMLYTSHNYINQITWHTSWFAFGTFHTHPTPSVVQSDQDRSKTRTRPRSWSLGGLVSAVSQDRTGPLGLVFGLCKMPKDRTRPDRRISRSKYKNESRGFSLAS